MDSRKNVTALARPNDPAEQGMYASVAYAALYREWRRMDARPAWADFLARAKEFIVAEWTKS